MFSLQQSINIVDKIDHMVGAPLTEQLDALYKGECSELILESSSLEDIENTLLLGYAEVPSMMLEAIKAKAAQLSQRVNAFSRALNMQLKTVGISVTGTEINKPRKSGAVAIQIARISLSDGQSVSMLFHAPDNDPLTINPDDTMIAFQFRLNNRDVTHVVAPKGGRDISLKQTTTSLAILAEKNSSKFQAAQEKKVAQTAELENAQSKIEQLESESATLNIEINDLESRDNKAQLKIASLQSQIDNQNEIQKELRKQLKIKQKKLDKQLPDNADNNVIHVSFNEAEFQKNLASEDSKRIETLRENGYQVLFERDKGYSFIKPDGSSVATGTTYTSSKNTWIIT